ncbi:MAG: 5'/3'-nucleotidase SurE [Thermoproteota archaeon]|nr:MAG: 5'/3'-nucleotidase SurE [Candidatus Korarchaeota archaeon]
MAKILLLNDDGPNSPPFLAFWKELMRSKIGEVYTITPEHEMSAAGKGLTLHKPLRLYKRVIEVDGEKGILYLTNGTPGDCVVVAIDLIIGSKPDLVISGINKGDNTTIDNLFTSGTIAGALQGVLNGAKAAAFSTEIPIGEFELEIDHFKPHAKIAVKIADWLIKNDLPGIHLLNVNFPYRVTEKTPIKLTRLGWTKFTNYVLERLDPRGRPYYWIASTFKDLATEGPDTDVYALEAEKAISITPIKLDLSIFSFLKEDPSQLREQAEQAVKKLNELISLLEKVKEEMFIH